MAAEASAQAKGAVSERFDELFRLCHASSPSDYLDNGHFNKPTTKLLFCALYYFEGCEELIDEYLDECTCKQQRYVEKQSWKLLPVDLKNSMSYVPDKHILRISRRSCSNAFIVKQAAAYLKREAFPQEPSYFATLTSPRLNLLLEKRAQTLRREVQSTYEKLMGDQTDVTSVLPLGEFKNMLWICDHTVPLMKNITMIEDGSQKESKPVGHGRGAGKSASASIHDSPIDLSWERGDAVASAAGKRMPTLDEISDDVEEMYRNLQAIQISSQDDDSSTAAVESLEETRATGDVGLARAVRALLHTVLVTKNLSLHNVAIADALAAVCTPSSKQDHFLTVMYFTIMENLYYVVLLEVVTPYWITRSVWEHFSHNIDELKFAKPLGEYLTKLANVSRGDKIPIRLILPVSTFAVAFLSEECVKSLDIKIVPDCYAEYFLGHVVYLINHFVNTLTPEDFGGIGKAVCGTFNRYWTSGDRNELPPIEEVRSAKELMKLSPDVADILISDWI